VSVTANVAPKAMHELCQAAMQGDVAKAVSIHMQLLPLHRDLFCEPNPIPVKWALARMGKAGGYLRLPLTTLSASAQERVESALRACNLI
jgi:4-hydroxy-tetrahydrodipicolinate synthase